jgi:glycosyltransferase involved in cell wall biosynthesis
VVGDAAVQFDPADPEAIAAAIVKAVTGGEALTQAGLHHVKAFTWEKCGDAHIKAYRAAQEGKNS